MKINICTLIEKSSISKISGIQVGLPTFKMNYFWVPIVVDHGWGFTLCWNMDLGAYVLVFYCIILLRAKGCYKLVLYTHCYDHFAQVRDGGCTSGPLPILILPATPQSCFVIHPYPHPQSPRTQQC